MYFLLEKMVQKFLCYFLTGLEEQENQKEVEAALPGGVFVDGIYYYPITGIYHSRAQSAVVRKQKQ